MATPAEKKAASQGIKPRGSTADAGSSIKPGMTMREAVAAAAKDAQKETGLSWRQGVKRRLSKVAEVE